MFCMKCGQLLPDDALFCSRCRAATAINQPAPTPAAEPTPIPSAELTPAPIPIVQSAPVQESTAANEGYRQNSPLVNKDSKTDSTRQTLVDAIDKLKESKSVRMAVVGILFAAALIISLCAFASMEEGRVPDSGTLTTALISGASALGFFVSIFIVRSQFDTQIKEKEDELARYDYEFKGGDKK